MSLIKDTYEISLWEDVHATAEVEGKTKSYYTEQKIAVIGSNTLEENYKVVEPQLVQNINGTNKLTFKMYMKYRDNVTGEKKENPFISLLVNERKVKLKWKGEWFDFVIKDVKEASDSKSVTYTCEDLYINELSRNGYSIELDTELENNIGTAQELAAVALDGSEWKVDTQNSDVIQEWSNEALYGPYTTLESFPITLPDKDGTKRNIGTNEDFYLYYSARVAETTPIQILIAKENTQLETTSSSMLLNRNTYDCGEVDDAYYLEEKTTVEGVEVTNIYIAKKIGETETKLANITSKTISNVYRGERLIRSQDSKYDSLLGRTVSIYEASKTGEETQTLYGYAGTDYSEAVISTNFMVSPQMTSTSGWSGDSSSEVLTWGVYPGLDSSFTSETVQHGYLKTTDGKKLYNSGLRSNVSYFEDGIHIGDVFYCRIKARPNVTGDTDAPDLSSYVLTNCFAPNVMKYNYDNLAKAKISDYFTVTYLGTEPDPNEFEVTEEEVSGAAYYWFDSSDPDPEDDDNNDPTYLFKYYGDTFDSSKTSYVLKSGGSSTVCWNVYKLTCSTAISLSEMKKVDLRLTDDEASAYSQYMSFYLAPTNTVWLEEVNFSRFYYENGVRIDAGAAQFSSLVNVNYHYYDPNHDNDGWQKKVDIVYDYAQSTDISGTINFSRYVKTEDPSPQEGKTYYHRELPLIEDSTTQTYTYAVVSGSFISGVTYYEKIDYEGYTVTPKTNDCFVKRNQISVSKSNRFNILQQIAETFQCWIRFYIEHETNGAIALDSNKNPKKTIRILNDYGEETGLSFVYGIDLKQISRTNASKTIATKTIVAAASVEAAENGICTIQRSDYNIPKTSYIYNFDYYISHGLIDVDQLNIDLYDSAVGLYPILNYNYLNAQTLSSELTEKETLLSKQQAYYKVYDEYVTGAEATLSEKLSNLLYVTSTKTYEEAVVAAKSAQTEDTIAALAAYNTIKNQTIPFYQKQRDSLAETIQTLQTEIETIEDEIAESNATAKEAELEFEHKYQRFIQEGTWTSSDYYDDNKYYLAALSTAYTSARPQVSYDISVLRLTALEEFKNKIFNVGDIGFIEDVEFFGYKADKVTPYKEQIIVSEITSYLDQPDKDSIKIQNYKTQFEDLFQRIAASTQSLQYASLDYARAASAVTTTGAIDADTFQNSFDTNTNFEINSLSNTVVTNSAGITVTNQTDANQKVRITSNGILLSKDGGTTWVNAITTNGISTSQLTAGGISAKEINIYGDNDNPAFRWNSAGINAYGTKTISQDNTTVTCVDYDKFVRFDKFGVYGMQLDDDREDKSEFIPTLETDITNNAYTKFSLTWSGFKMITDNGQVSITSDEDFTIKNKDGTVKLKIGQLTDSTYGIRINDQNGNSVFETDSNGHIYGKYLTIDGTIKSSIFETGSTSAVGGKMFFRPCYKIKEWVTNESTKETHIYLESAHNKTTDEKTKLHNAIFYDPAGGLIGEYLIYFSETDEIIITNWDKGETTLEVGSSFVDLGEKEATTLMMGINATDAYSKSDHLYPYAFTFYDKIYDSTTEKTTYSDRMVLGNLDNIENPPFEKMGGYGLYADNVYLNGTLTTKNKLSNHYGGVNTLATATSEGSDPVIFWCGALSNSDTDIVNANFTVTDSGILKATGAQISGDLYAVSIHGGKMGEEQALKLYSLNRGIQFINVEGSNEVALNLTTSGFTYGSKDFITFDTDKIISKMTQFNVDDQKYVGFENNRIGIEKNIKMGKMRIENIDEGIYNIYIDE